MHSLKGGVHEPMETGEPNSPLPCHAVAGIIYDGARSAKKPGFSCHPCFTAPSSSRIQPSEAGFLASVGAQLFAGPPRTPDSRKPPKLTDMRRSTVWKGGRAGRSPSERLESVQDSEIHRKSSLRRDGHFPSPKIASSGGDSRRIWGDSHRIYRNLTRKLDKSPQSGIIGCSGSGANASLYRSRKFRDGSFLSDVARSANQAKDFTFPPDRFQVCVPCGGFLYPRAISGREKRFGRP